MARLKRLAAREVFRLLRKFGFEVESIRGSHAKLVRNTANGQRQILVVPIQRQLTVGTLHGIYRQACRYVSRDELRPLFFAD